MNEYPFIRRALRIGIASTPLPIGKQFTTQEVLSIGMEDGAEKVGRLMAVKAGKKGEGQ